MSERINRHLTIKLDDVAHLFVAPEFDPFSDQDARLLGQPALLYLLRKLGPEHLKQGGTLSLTVQLPPEKVTLDLKARVEQALRRYCDVRIADDQAQLRIMRSNGLRFAAFGDYCAGGLFGAVLSFLEQRSDFLVACDE